ncbi:MAG: starch-binding protein [Muribaculaceae bacterium]|nr:starch-binding protein [Muribaculaceae bacterium]
MRTAIFKLTVLLLLAMTASQQAWGSFVGPRNDFRDESIYFVITTRFYDGDPDNNAQCWDGANANHGDPCWRGDFKGLIDKLDYIKALGFTAVWVTPIVENASGLDYHGYHASNFSRVDHRYESGDTTFQTLIDEAHARGMKVILDIVLNHTGNFGEEHLCKLFTRDREANQFKLNECMLPYTTDSVGGRLPTNYSSLPAGQQYDARLKQMKNTDNQNHDTHNYWHHFGQFNWDDNTRWWAQIAGDCVDLNTENPAVAEYLIDCYGTFIKMGVDGFRIDTGGHISRLTFNKIYVPAFKALGEQYKSKRLNQAEFFLYTEVCARYQGSVTYRNQPALSPYFYTWAENKNYSWNNDPTYWDGIAIYESTDLNSLDNIGSCQQMYADNNKETSSAMPTSNNAVLDGNSYHAPDVSRASGLNVIDFPVHYSFHNIGSVWSLALNGDKYYNDATYNVVYVDSHDYSPGPNDNIRFNEGTAQWAENLSLMFTFRGIPCLYYGSEIEFKAGKTIDPGGNGSLKDSGRAYYGGYIKGNVTVNDFGQASGATGNLAATLSKPLVKHLQRLNCIRQAVPALRKGQYSTSGCSSTGGYAFKRRYTDSTTDSYVLVTINGPATFSGVLNGTYTDCITGDVKTVTNGSLTTTSCSGKGNMRIYVLSTNLTPAPGKIGEDGPYLYTSSPNNGTVLSYDGTEEELSSNDGEGNGTSPVTPPLEEYEPSCEEDDMSVFLETGTSVSNVTTWVWNSSTNFTGGSWPGQAMTLMGTTNGGTRKIWKWTYQGSNTGDPTGIIFVTDGQQTSDLTFRNHGYYIDGTWHHEVTNYTSPAPTLSIDKASGHYEGSVTVTITASESDAVIVYTTNGTTPTAGSSQATGHVTLTFTDNTVLTAGVLFEGKVRNVIQREYIFHGFVPYTATVYIKDPTLAPNNWSSVWIYAWDSSGTLNDSWPGVQITGTKIVKGQKFYYRSFNVDSEDYSFNVVLSQGDNQHQSEDVTGISKDIYLEVTSTTNKYTVADVTDQYTSYLIGDLNNDGEVNISDVINLINIILSSEPLDEEMHIRCDINSDKEVNISDVIVLINLILNNKSKI